MSIKDRYISVVSKVKDAATKAGRAPSTVELLAVSKKHPVSSISEVYALGQRAFGENYASELFSKAQEAKELGLKDIEWVYIGSLQSNKISKLVSVCSSIQTVSSLKHLRYIDRYAAENSKSPFPVFLQVNISRDPAKSGLDPDKVEELVTESEKMNHVQVVGLMAIPSKEDSLMAGKCTIPNSYPALKLLAEKLGLKQVSLGMSADLEPAVTSGSTMVRIGTDIFGTRKEGPPVT